MEVNGGWVGGGGVVEVNGGWGGRILGYGYR